MAQQVVVIEPDYFSVEVTAPQTVTISNTGPQGATGPTGATGATGPQGPSGVVSVSSPITNTGTSTAANIGIDQTLLSVTQSQVTNLTTDLAAKAPLASPTFTGDPKAPTPTVDDNDTSIATTAFVLGQAGSTNPVMDGSASAGTSTRFARQDHVHPTDTSRAPLNSPTFTGTPAAPTAAVDTNTTQVATTAYVVGQGYLKSATASSTYAPLASPTFTGDPKAPTPTSTDNDTSIATTAFVQAQKTSPALAGTPTAPTAAVNTSTTQLATTEFVDEGTNDIRQYASDKSVLENIPARVHPAENLLKQAVFWIDSNHSSASGQTITNLGWGGSTLNATAGSSGSADSNDPKFLSWDGTNYVYLPGVASNYLSVPDANDLDITGDIDVRVQVAMDDWTPGSAAIFAAKSTGSGNQQSWYFAMTTGGNLSFRWSTNGSTLLSEVYSSVATGITDGATKWIRVTLDVDNGASGNDVKFYTSDDGVTWTQLGTTQTQAGTTSIFASTAVVEFGSRNAGTTIGSAGKVFRGQVRNGIDGTPVLDVDTSLINSGSATSFTARTGQTVTINRATSGRKTVAVVHPVWLFGTDDYIEVADNDLLDFGATDSFTVMAVIRQPSFTASKAILSKSQWTYSKVGYTISRASTASGVYFTISDGTNHPYTANATQTAGTLTTFVGVRDTVADTIALYQNGTLVSSVTDTTTGTLANTYGVRVGTENSGAYNDMENIAVAIFRRVLTAAEIQTLSNYFQGRAV